MLQYKIPQNVQIEDKIFGNILTLRQLIILGIGGGISYIIYTYLARVYVLGALATGIICIPFLISMAFAFIRIHNIPLFKFCLLFIEFILKPRKRVWNKEGDIVLTIPVKPGKDKTKKLRLKSESKEKLDIQELSKVLNVGQLSKEQGAEKIYSPKT